MANYNSNYTGQEVDAAAAKLQAIPAASDITSAVTRGLVKPTQAPTVVEFVGIDSTGSQVHIQIDTNDFEFGGTTSLYTLKKKKNPYPLRGQIINMNLDGTNRRYRVVNINGSLAEVIAMFNVTTMKFGSSEVYAGSNLDTYLNSTWYGALSTIAKAAIVDKTFRQDSWYWGSKGNPDYSGFYGWTNPGNEAFTISLGNTTFGSELTRHVYALGVQDVVDLMYYIDTTGVPLQNYNFWNMFWGDTVSHGTSHFWLRSAFANESTIVWRVSGPVGCVGYDIVSNTNNEVRPAFTIDLSKISYE